MRWTAWIVLAVLSSCGSSASNVSDVRCAADGGCPNELVCASVTAVRVGTGDCLASSGALVCRPRCTECPPKSPCGCVCP